MKYIILLIVLIYIICKVLKCIIKYETQGIRNRKESLNCVDNRFYENKKYCDVESAKENVYVNTYVDNEYEELRIQQEIQEENERYLLYLEEQERIEQEEMENERIEQERIEQERIEQEEMENELEEIVEWYLEDDVEELYFYDD